MSIIPSHTDDIPCALCSLKLEAAHPFLRDWFNNKIKPAFRDAHISWALRDYDSQEKAYVAGESKLHFPYSAHNKTPSMALDLFQLNDWGKAVWAPSFFKNINDYNLNKGIKLKWGNEFKCLGDDDHFELESFK